MDSKNQERFEEPVPPNLNTHNIRLSRFLIVNSITNYGKDINDILVQIRHIK